MTHRGGLILCVIAAGVLTAFAGADIPLFASDRLGGSFEILETRGCLPRDFVIRSEMQPSCRDTVFNGDVPPECDDAPLLHQFEVCVALRSGQLNQNATKFNSPDFISTLLSRTNDQEWQDSTLVLFNECQRASAPWLTAVQQTVYTFSCTRWSLFSDCDLRQEREWRLDEAGALRRARFLSGNCPLSPFRLRNILESISHRTWEECGRKDYGDVGGYHQSYAEISRIACLLKDFTWYGGFINFPKLKASIIDQINEFPESVQLLAEIVIPCSTKKHLHNAYPVTVEEFIKCWARRGIFSCVYQEANEVAENFPSDCLIFL